MGLPGPSKTIIVKPQEIPAAPPREVPAPREPVKV